MLSFTHGSCIDLDFDFRDVDGQPEDIGEDQFSVISAYPSALADAVLTKTEPGRLHLHLPSEQAAKLFSGRVNQLRVSRRFADGCVENTDVIWIATR